MFSDHPRSEQHSTSRLCASAVRQAIKAGRLAATKVGGQYRLRPEAVASYELRPRGPTSEDASAPVLEVVCGAGSGIVLGIRHDGDFESERILDGRSGIVRGWTRAMVRTVLKKDDDYRVFILEPGRDTNDIRIGDFYVSRRFTIVERVNNSRQAHERWTAEGRAEPATAPR